MLKYQFSGVVQEITVENSKISLKIAPTQNYILRYRGSSYLYLADVSAKPKIVVCQKKLKDNSATLVFDIPPSPSWNSAWTLKFNILYDAYFNHTPVTLAFSKSSLPGTPPFNIKTSIAAKINKTAKSIHSNFVCSVSTVHE